MNLFDVTLWSPVRKFICFGLITLTLIGYAFQSIAPQPGHTLHFREVLIGCAIFYLGGVFGWRDSPQDVVDGFDDEDREIENLQRQLSNATYSMSRAEARGDHGSAAHFRTRVHELESKLRRLGA